MYYEADEHLNNDIAAEPACRAGQQFGTWPGASHDYKYPATYE